MFLIYKLSLVRTGGARSSLGFALALCARCVRLLQATFFQAGNSFRSFLLLFFFVFSFFRFFTFSVALAQSLPDPRQNLQVFGSEPLAQEQSKGRSLSKCLSDLDDFLSAGIGINDMKFFAEYFHDFIIAFRSPTQYADIANLEAQVNKARYAVMSAFFRCDLERRRPSINAYWQLSAELYFIRHLKDSNQFPFAIRTTTPELRQAFFDEFMKAMLSRRGSTSDQDRITFSAYFELFEAKYNERAKQYGLLTGGPYEDIIERVKEVSKGLSAFKDLGNEFALLFNEAIIEPATDITGEGDVDKGLIKPGISFKGILSGVVKVFDACVTTPNDRYCVSDVNLTGSDDDYGFDVDEGEDPFPKIGSGGKRRTYEQVRNSIIRQRETLDFAQNSADLLKRYELLYGQVSGSGVATIMSRMDKLIETIGPKNSTKAIKAIAQCAGDVEKKECQ